MKVGVLCEESLTVREAFAARGHDAWSCDILPRCGQHRFGRAQDFDWSGFDILICHPPCTYLCRSGQRWLTNNPRRWKQMEEAAAFFLWCLGLPASIGVAVENSRMHVHAAKIVGVPATQIIQPWQFGHGEVKETHLWLRGLPPLRPTNVVDGRSPRVHQTPPGPLRSRDRSKMFPGIAAAMADQWGSLDV